MTAVRSVAIVGAGFAGTAAGILLAQGGVEVVLYDAKPEVGALGSGITVQGNACRIFQKLGVWDEVQAHSYGADITGIRLPDADATVVAMIPDAKTGGPDVPATVGMFRPEAADILLRRAAAVGVTVRWSAKVHGIDNSATGAVLHWTDATGAEQTDTYDLVIGADGLNSTVRSLIGIDIHPRRTGMGIWRAFVDRPAEVTHTDLYYGGECYIAGYCPTSEQSMYAYLVEASQDRTNLTDEESVEIMRELMESYHGPWDTVRAGLSTASSVNYTWFTTHIVEGPWHRDRVAIIGDAAHSCPPTLAQGAAMALEDAAVLAELLLAKDAVTDELWDEFAARRFDRAKSVVDASVQIGDWMLSHDPNADVPGLMRQISNVVSIPA